MNIKELFAAILPWKNDNKRLAKLQLEAFSYFKDDNLVRNGMIADKNKPGSPASIAAMGLGLSSFIIGVERGYMPREEAIKKTLQILAFLRSSRQGAEADASGYKGFYYHFLDMETGVRVWQCELSTIDTAILMAGALTAANYFKGDNGDEAKIRKIAAELYERVDWVWALNGGTTITHGWKPESGFLPQRWDKGYNEAHILYILALGSPTFPVSDAAYNEWIATFEWKNIYGTELLYAGPLFIHQLSQLWLDFRGIYDACNRKYGIDYFENSSRAVYVQREYAKKNPLGFKYYSRYVWGLSASDGPGPATYNIKGVEREFFDYIARGAPYGPDDGTVSPWAIVASLPFAPKAVLNTMRMDLMVIGMLPIGDHGIKASFNATFPEKSDNPFGWLAKWQFGLNQGPVIMMIENYWSGLIWKVFGQCNYVADGIKKAGFTKK
jgi:hypothetical protein